MNEKGLPLVCLNYDLTCDNIPHCAHTEIPNPDENCDEGVGEILTTFDLWWDRK